MIELILVTTIKDNKKSFYRYVNDKRKNRENLSPLCKDGGELVTWDVEKAEILNNIFTSVFTNKCFRHTT